MLPYAARSLAVSLFAFGFVTVEGANAQAITMSWYTIDAGGGSSSAGVFQLSGTIGQLDAGTIMTGGPYSLRSGFWHGRPPSCTADFNGDGVINSQDFFDFLVVFFALEPAADVNHDAAINSQDFFDFLTVFFSGC